MLKMIPIAQIHVNFEWNSRKNITEESCMELAASIKSRGLDIPVTVRPKGEEFSLVCGFRRIVAFNILEKTEIPAFIKDLDDYQAKIQNFSENADREPLTFWEDCMFLKTTFPPEVQLSQIQEDINKNYAWVRPRRQIWDLPNNLVTLAEEGTLNARDIGELLKRDPAERMAASKAADRATLRGETKKHIKKTTVKRRSVQGRKNVQRMMNIIEQNDLTTDPNIHPLLLWAMGDLDKVTLAKRLKVNPEIFLAIEE